jgi:hypothetical protein
MGGLALLLSKSKPSKEEDDLDTEKSDAEGDAEGEKEAGLEDEFLGDAFDALKSGNKEAFIGAMKSCLEK